MNYEHSLITKMQLISTLSTPFQSIKCSICYKYCKVNTYGHHLFSNCGKDIDTEAIYTQMQNNEFYKNINDFIISYHGSKAGQCIICGGSPSDFNEHTQMCIGNVLQFNMACDNSCTSSLFPHYICRSEIIAFSITLLQNTNNPTTFENQLKFFFCFGFTQDRINAAYKYECDQLQNNIIHLNSHEEEKQVPLCEIAEPIVEKNPEVKYNIKETIGSGTFGKVYKAERKGSFKIVAIKIINEKKMPSKYLYGETGTLVSMADKNVICLLDSVHLWKHHLFFIFEMAQTNGLKFMWELRQWAGNGPGYILVMKAALLQIASGLEYIHSKKIIHRDLKLENLLAFFHGTWKIADFGTAIELYIRDAKSVVGTVGLMSPEMLELQKYTEKTDIFSFGIVLLMVIYPEVFIDATTKQLEPLNIIETLKNRNLSFPIDLLNPDPSKRPKANELHGIINNWSTNVNMAKIKTDFCVRYVHNCVIRNMNIRKQLKERTMYEKFINRYLKKNNEMEISFDVKDSINLDREVIRYSQTFLNKTKARNRLQSKLKQKWNNITSKLK